MRSSESHAMPGPFPGESAGSFALLNAIVLPCAVFDPEDNLVFANEAFKTEFSHEPSVKEGTSFSRWSFLQAFHRYGPMAKGYGHPMLLPSERPALHADEEVYDPVTRQSYTFHWRKGGQVDPSATVLTVKNLTEARRSQAHTAGLQEQLMLTSRSMSVGEMATTIAHELNQPLGSILNYLGVAKTLLQAATKLDKAQEAVMGAILQAERATSVIARVREFVRNREPEKELCHAAELIDSVISLLSLEIRKHGVQVKVSVEDGLPGVCADRVMLELVFANLVRNAIEAMETSPPDQRFLSIQAGLDMEQRLKVVVQDSGCGVPEENVDNLFQAFYTSKQNGMGAGLAICRSIMEFHGGRLYFEPAEPAGSAFVCCLPAYLQEKED